MLKSSVWIKDQAIKSKLIDPFIDTSVRKGVISYGLGPFGYDMRLDQSYKIIKTNSLTIDPHHTQEDDYETKMEQKILLNPGDTILGKSIEYFNMPQKVLGLVYGKSTYARSGILINVTPIEPEWSGYITISISNVSRNQVALYPLEGIAQILFFESDAAPLYSYKDLKGKYNDQKEITIAKIE